MYRAMATETAATESRRKLGGQDSWPNIFFVLSSTSLWNLLPHYFSVSFSVSTCTRWIARQMIAVVLPLFCFNDLLPSSLAVLGQFHCAKLIHYTHILTHTHTHTPKHNQRLLVDFCASNERKEATLVRSRLDHGISITLSRNLYNWYPTFM